MEKLTKKAKAEMKLLLACARLIEKNYGKSHVKKHSFDFDDSCIQCRAQFVVSFLKNAEDLIRWWYSGGIDEKPKIC